MGGQDNASTLIPAILGLGGNVTGIAVNRPGLGQPLTQFSQQMQERQLEQQRLQQQASQEAVRRKQAERGLQLREAQTAGYLQSLGLREKGLQAAEARAGRAEQRQQTSLDIAKERFNLQKKEAINKANLQLQVADKINKMKEQGKFLSPQDYALYDGMLAKGDIRGASDFLQKTDRYARIRDLQDQGKLDPNKFDEQVAGLYPELAKNKLGMKTFISGAKKVFVEDPGWFQSKKLIPQTPRQNVGDGWSIKKK